MNVIKRSALTSTYLLLVCHIDVPTALVHHLVPLENTRFFLQRHKFAAFDFWFASFLFLLSPVLFIPPDLVTASGDSSDEGRGARQSWKKMCTPNFYDHYFILILSATFSASPFDLFIALSPPTPGYFSVHFHFHLTSTPYSFRLLRLLQL